MNDQHTTGATRVTVMTGATSGIGSHALAHLAAEPGARIIVGARGTGRTVPDGVEVLPLDLASLPSVRAFAAAVTARLDGAAIDALVLNAGTQSRNATDRTSDGFETTFAVNHLAHYLLARLLEPHLADGARLILTTSDTHDPAITPLAPKHLEPEALAHPPKPAFGMRTYAATKLCNLLTARSLADDPAIGDRGITVIAYNPGFTGGTNLGGEASPGAERVMRYVVFPIFAVVGLFKPAYSVGKPERGGEVLAALATGTLRPPAGHVYASVVKGKVTFPEPSALARDNTVRDDLWQRSAAMVGLADQAA